MEVIDALIRAAPAGKVRQVQIGLFWTAVVVEEGGAVRCGLAATMRAGNHAPGREPEVRAAGTLAGLPARELIELACSDHPTEASVGLAAINALSQFSMGKSEDTSGEDFITRGGTDRNVAVVGHFPFVEGLKERVKALWVLELNPRGDDLPADAAPDVLPRADVVAITATTLLNRTFDGLIRLCRPDAQVILLGPSTPLSPVLFDFGVTVLCGAVVDKIDPVLRGVSQGANFHQLRPLGARFATILK